MENNNILEFKFIKENSSLKIDLNSPNFSDFVRQIISENLEVSDENIELEFDKENIDVDIEQIKKIIIEIHSKYESEIKQFYSNIKEDIKTYYDDNEKISKAIISEIETLEKKDE